MLRKNILATMVSLLLTLSMISSNIMFVFANDFNEVLTKDTKIDDKLKKEVEVVDKSEVNIKIENRLNNEESDKEISENKNKEKFIKDKSFGNKKKINEEIEKDESGRDGKIEDKDLDKEKSKVEGIEYDKRFDPHIKPLRSVMSLENSELNIIDTINVNKTAKRSLGCRTFEITLDITGKRQKAPVDLVILIDRSGSMNYKVGGMGYTRLYYAKKSVIDFTTRLLGANGIPGSRVSIVSFSGPRTREELGDQNQATTDLNFSNDLNSVINAVNSIVAGGGTNTEAGFIQAESVLSTSNNLNSNKSLIMVTDGLPTASNGKIYEETLDIEHPHIQKAIKAGESIHQKKIADVFTIGLTNGMDEDSKKLVNSILTKVQNKGYYESPSAEDLNSIFTSISTDLGYSAREAKVIDKIGSDFDLIESSLPSNVSYNDRTREISWNPGTIAEKSQLRYTIVAKKTVEGGMGEEDKLYTNEFAKLNYNDVLGSPQEKSFPKPKVNVPTFIKIVLTDATIINGEDISLGIETNPSEENYMSPVTGGDNDGKSFTYEWKIKGTNIIISNDKNPLVSPKEDTEYEVRVKDSNGCVAIATMKVKVINKYNFGIKKIDKK